MDSPRPYRDVVEGSLLLEQHPLLRGGRGIPRGFNHGLYLVQASFTRCLAQGSSLRIGPERRNSFPSTGIALPSPASPFLWLLGNVRPSVDGER